MGQEAFQVVRPGQVLVCTALTFRWRFQPQSTWTKLLHVSHTWWEAEPARIYLLGGLAAYEALSWTLSCFRRPLSFSAVPQPAARTCSSCICTEGGVTLGVLFGRQCSRRPETTTSAPLSLHAQGWALTGGADLIQQSPCPGCSPTSAPYWTQRHSQPGGPVPASSSVNLFQGSPPQRPPISRELCCSSDLSRTPCLDVTRLFFFFFSVPGSHFALLKATSTERLSLTIPPKSSRYHVLQP